MGDAARPSPRDRGHSRVKHVVLATEMLGKRAARAVTAPNVQRRMMDRQAGPLEPLSMRLAQGSRV